MTLYVFDAGGVFERDPNSGEEHPLEPVKPPLSDFIEVDFVQPPFTSDPIEGERLLLEAIATAAVTILVTPPTT